MKKEQYKKNKKNVKKVLTGNHLFVKISMYDEERKGFGVNYKKQMRKYLRYYLWRLCNLSIV